MGYRIRLIDWIVATGVVVLGFAVFVTAVNTYRFAGYRPDCQNRLRQIGLGILGYANAKGQFPAAAKTDETGQPVASVFTTILPYLDSQDLYNAYNFSVPSWDPANAPVVSTRIPILTCPDNTNRDDSPPGFPPSHYAVNWGGGRNGFGTDFVAKNGTDRGLMGENWGVPLYDIPDGADSTLMAGEKRVGRGWAVGGWGASLFDVGPGSTDPGTDPAAWPVYTGSFHKDGSNFAFADGAVRYIDSNLDPKIWYALITRNGRETAKLPGY